jgi:integrase
VVQENGRRLLERNPLAGLPSPNSDTVSRPILLHEQYEAMLAVAPQVNPLFELALVLANETGHRVGATRLLRWSDITLSDKPFRPNAAVGDAKQDVCSPETSPSAPDRRSQDSPQQSRITNSRPDTTFRPLRCQ